MSEDKGLERTYGRGSGERKYRPIPMFKPRRRFHSALFHPGHASYPQSGAYATEEPSVTDNVSDLSKSENV